jgi:hypothetical protein
MASQRDIKELLSGKETTILAALGIRLPPRAGDHIKCPFPYHDDKKPSWRWDQNKARFFCTCDPSSGSIIDVVIAMRGGDFASASQWCRELVGIDSAPTRSAFRHSKHGEPVATWSYHDSKGNVAGVAVRYETPKGKQVVPWIPDGKGGWTPKAMPSPRPLYRLPRLLADKDKPVLITEGEKAADAAARLFPDHVVTTSVGGCSAWRMSDWKRLSKRRVVIWPDNDDPGRDYARNVAGALEETEVFIVELDARFPIKWDLADPKPEGVTDEDLRTLIEGAKRYEPPAAAALPQVADVKDDFERDKDGKLVKNEGNILRAMQWSGIAVRYDCFSDRYQITGLEGYGPLLEDHAVDELYLLFQREYGLKPTKQDFDRVIFAAARRSRFHPVKQYLETLEWDGVDRIDEWLSTYGSAENDHYTRAVGRIVLIAAVRRIYEAGIKFDQILVLEGEQGTGKSTAVAALCHRSDWFSESLSMSADERQIIEQTAGKWLIEIGELSGYRKREVEHIKEFLSRRVDSARLAYGRLRVERPRQFIFIGTTNESNYLMDDTGDRRFWPVRIREFDITSLERDRDQLWAEAAYYARRGESIQLATELWPVAKQEQDARSQQDEWERVVADWLTDELDRPQSSLMDGGYRTTITAVAKGALNIEAGKLEPPLQKRLVRCMKRAGWYRAERSDGRNFWRPRDSAVQ